MASGNGTPRVYTISTETANGLVNSDALSDEIAADGTVGGLTLNRIDTGGNSLNVYFAVSLSAGETTALDSVVSGHQGAATGSNFQFWELNTAQTTQAQTFQPAMSRTASALAEGVYRVAWRYELKITPTGPVNSKARSQFSIDSSIKGSSTSIENEWIEFSGWDRYIAAEGDTPVLLLEFERDPTEGGNDTIEIRKMKLGIELMD